MDMDAGPILEGEPVAERRPAPLRHDPRRGERRADQERAAGCGGRGVRALDDRAHTVKPAGRGARAAQAVAILVGSAHRSSASADRWRSLELAGWPGS